MPCFLGCLALFVPRIVLACIFLFSHYLGNAYRTVHWPLIGFFLMPVTTLAYAFAINSHGKLDGAYLFLYVVAVLIDLGLIGGGARSRKWRRRHLNY